MPPEASQTTPTENVVDLDKPISKLEFKKNKFYLVSAAAVVVVIILVISAYGLGTSSNNSPNLQKNSINQATSSAQAAPNVKTGFLGDKIDVTSGLTIQLNEATIDQQYEQTKKQQKSYYQNNASQSAYLNSDYFHQSNLVMKISLTNNNKTSVAYNPGSFRLKDSQDNQYVAPYEGQNGVNVYSLNPAETTKITVSYLVPDTETDFKLIYENALIKFSI